jgi:predicted phage terminase large subunit-like protein
MDAYQHLDLEEFNAALRNNFGFFCEIGFRELHNGRDWIDAPYLRLLEHVFTSCHKRKTRRLLLNMPPRFLKSMFASVFYPAWQIAQNPAAKIICASYSDDLNTMFSRQVRRLVRSTWFVSAFSETVLSNDKSAAGHLETDAGGRIYSTTPGGTIAGVGADDIILDDIMKPQTANSAEARAVVRNWLEGEVLSRFDKPAEGVLIAVMHRLHPEDICAHLEASGIYTTVKLPLVAEVEGCFTDRTTKAVVFERTAGDLLNPDFLPNEEIERLKKETPHSVWMARYQQAPVIAGAGIVKSEWFPRYDEPPAFRAVFQSWDIATTKNDGDYSVCTTWGYVDGKFYLIDVYRRQIEFPDLRKAVRDLDAKYKPDSILIETVFAGISLYQDLERLGMKNICRCNVRIDKVTRMEACTPFFQDGNVLLPNDAPWLPAFLSELQDFPVGMHDDQVDSVSQIIGYRAEMLDRSRIVSKYRVTVKSF